MRGYMLSNTIHAFFLKSTLILTIFCSAISVKCLERQGWQRLRLCSSGSRVSLMGTAREKFPSVAVPTMISSQMNSMWRTKKNLLSQMRETISRSPIWSLAKSKARSIVKHKRVFPTLVLSEVLFYKKMVI